jgi:toxin ParE1/3/4
VSRVVVVEPDARSDLVALYRFIAEQGHPLNAIAYVDRLRRYCMGFADFPERGNRRDDLRPGLRTIGFEGRVTIAFHFDDEAVHIDRILYGGRDLSAAFD